MTTLEEAGIDPAILFKELQRVLAYREELRSRREALTGDLMMIERRIALLREYLSMEATS